jgi:hypothetical protein
MRNKVCLLLLALSVVFSVKAQEFKKFKVGLGLGYAKASGEGSKGGVLVYLEPAYRVQDNLLVGLRMESAIITRGLSEDPGNLDIDVAAIGSYTINGQYYFSNNTFRPFAGVGLGLYSLAAVKIGDAVEGVEAGTKFGFYPRVGFDLGHFNLSLDYNIIPPSEAGVSLGDAEFKNSYFGFRMGFSIGGGKK